jgi:hypothetical protein
MMITNFLITIGKYILSVKGQRIRRVSATYFSSSILKLEFSSIDCFSQAGKCGHHQYHNSTISFHWVMMSLGYGLWIMGLDYEWFMDWIKMLLMYLNYGTDDDCTHQLVKNSQWSKILILRWKIRNKRKSFFLTALACYKLDCLYEKAMVIMRHVEWYRSKWQIARQIFENNSYN